MIASTGLLSAQDAPLSILFLCTAHNSLSQRLSLVLKARGHAVTVELAISDEIMIEATNLASPDLIICPFLTKKVPSEVYSKFLTLIIHPGPPGDAGPSAIDWALLGDDGIEADASKALEKISENTYVAKRRGRSHWGVTVLQAIEEFDAGPVWAWDQFPITLDGPNAPTKASLYRGPVTKAAVDASLKAIERISNLLKDPSLKIGPHLAADYSWGKESVTTGQTFLGGKTHTRPLLKPSERNWIPSIHSAEAISRRLRASDSQPGVQSSIFFNKNLYLYGGIVERNQIPFEILPPGSIIAQRDNAVLVSTADGKGVWITHIRKLKPKNETLLPPKLPAMLALRSIPEIKDRIDLDTIPVWSLSVFDRVPGTYQEVWIEYEVLAGVLKTAFVYSDFYNGAASTFQCQKLLAAIEEACHEKNQICGLVLMGGGYFNNGIHLGVCSTNIAPESWANINAINDCVKAVLQQKKIVTFAAIRGNVAAGGFALATCCDFVLSVENAVINPHYRAVGLYGSEYHSLTWYARAGEENTRSFMRGMLPMSAADAFELGLVDQVIPQSDDPISDIKLAVNATLLAPTDSQPRGAPWTRKNLYNGNAPEHRRVLDAVPLRKQSWMQKLPQDLSSYAKQELDFMKLTFTDPRYHTCVAKFAGKAAAEKTPYRFALHRRYEHWQRALKDAEEDINYFSYPNIDPKAVSLSLEIDFSESIELISPPSVSWRPNSSSILLDTNPGNVQGIKPRSNSDATTLIHHGRSPSSEQAQPLTPDLSPSPESGQPLTPDISRDFAASPISPRFSLQNISPGQSPVVHRRVSRVVKKIKSALGSKVDESGKPIDGIKTKFKPSNNPSPSPTVSSFKVKPLHQMSCYYSATDDK
ncbi:hypothetical protein PPACK8108_LOCUS1432 [Phakopsora pachyrhizi]|uniref:Formyl transferase C-terminal domain-containing protein n=1 Tax=Phakopsora pachyrhizi TaxID=170000 RepID=A0AAV0AJU4_PHAPC|nr:hypothetical protein PPACK8108_LOCUS1432 [Phakopsora pachyrhizi]